MDHDEGGVKAAIRNLHTHYSHMIDDLRIDELANLFCRDGEWIAGDMRFAGRDAIREGIRQIEPPQPGMVKHLSFNPIVRIEGNRAFSWADGIALVVAPDDVTVAAAGRYHDEFIVEGGAWRFRQRVFVYSGAPLPDGVRASPGYPE